MASKQKQAKRAVGGAVLAKAAQKQSQKQSRGKKRSLLRRIMLLAAVGGAAYKAKDLLKPPAPAFPAPPAVPYVPPTVKAPVADALDTSAEAPIVQAADIGDNLDTDTAEPSTPEPAEELTPAPADAEPETQDAQTEDAQTDMPDGASPVGGAGYEVKGNIRRDGTKIFHEPGTRYYATTNAEIWFATPAHAIAAGYRAPRS